MTTTNIRPIIEQIAEKEHMGKVCSDAQIDMTLRLNDFAIYWDAIVNGRVVRQGAFFKFTSIQLGGE